MIELERHRALKYTLFFNLYFAEGLMIAITTVVTALYLRDKGIYIPIVTLVVGVVNIPWILKFVWGPIVDHFIRFGRKTFIIFGGALSVLGMLLASAIDPNTSLILFASTIFMSHVGIGFIDVSTDAWAVDVSTKKDRGKINGAMFAGQYSAWAIGAALLPFIGYNFGYSYAYLINGLIILAILIFPALVKEIKKIKTKQRIGSIVLKEFKKRPVQLILLFSPLVFMNEGMMSFIMPIFMRDSLGLADVQVGLISMILPLFLALGSIAGGITTDKFGRKKMLYLFLFLNAVFVAALIFANNWWKLSVIYGAIGFIMGAHSTISCALFMDFTNPKIGATQYGIFTGVANIGLNGGGMLTGSMVVALGFSRTFLYAGWVFGPALLLLYFIKLSKNKIVI